MRGSRSPALRPLTTDLQNKLRGLSRHRRGKVAHAAHTTLVKVDQWARGGAMPADLSGAIERVMLAAAERKSKAKTA
jgi:hypothetical protein